MSREGDRSKSNQSHNYQRVNKGVCWYAGEQSQAAYQGGQIQLVTITTCATSLIIWFPNPLWIKNSILEEKKGGVIARSRYVDKGKKVITSRNEES